MIEMDEMKGRGKRGLLRVVFGRTMFFLLFIALQLAFFFWIYVWLDNKYQAWGYGSFALISAKKHSKTAALSTPSQVKLL